MQDHRFYSAALTQTLESARKFPGLENMKINCPKLIYYTYLTIPACWFTTEA